jgi:hypothetical protein
MTTDKSTLLKALAANFEKCVKGYHLINTDPIKEGVWESVNTTVLQESGVNVTYQSNGSHSSGMDISCETFGNLSNKSSKYDKNTSPDEHAHANTFSISSYRLTKVCDAQTPGNIPEIIQEINKRKNFNFYSILVRDEKEEFKYDWYLIPANHPAFSPESYTWQPSYAKIGPNKGTKQVGWETSAKEDGSKMKIQFSMSSQLWINVPDVSKYLVATTNASKKNEINYINLYNIIKK